MKIMLMEFMLVNKSLMTLFKYCLNVKGRLALFICLKLTIGQLLLIVI